MKIGDIVQVVDGSWSLSLVEGTFFHENGNALRGRNFRVLSTHGSYPVHYHCSNADDSNERNDVMLFKIDRQPQIVSNQSLILFTKEQFCRRVYPVQSEGGELSVECKSCGCHNKIVLQS